MQRNVNERSLHLSEVRGIFPRAMRDEGSRWLQMNGSFEEWDSDLQGGKSSGIRKDTKKNLEKLQGKDRAFRSSHNRKSKD